MANIMRWRYGDTNPVMAAVGADTVIEIGDLVCQLSGEAVPASAMEDLGSEAGNQEAFHDTFIGVAMQSSPAGNADPIRVATSGVFEFDCLSATIELGDLLGPDEDGAGTALVNQTVAAVATANPRWGAASSASTRQGRACWSTWSARSPTAVRRAWRSRPGCFFRDPLSTPCSQGATIPCHSTIEN
jgi:hypothetical protein